MNARGSRLTGSGEEHVNVEIEMQTEEDKKGRISEIDKLTTRSGRLAIGDVMSINDEDIINEINKEVGIKAGGRYIPL